MTGPEYFSLVWRMPAYQGTIAMLMDSEQQSGSGGSREYVGSSTAEIAASPLGELFEQVTVE